jgi:hypothetical protein
LSAQLSADGVPGDASADRAADDQADEWRSIRAQIHRVVHDQGTTPGARA